MNPDLLLYLLLFLLFLIGNESMSNRTRPKIIRFVCAANRVMRAPRHARTSTRTLAGCRLKMRGLRLGSFCLEGARSHFNRCFCRSDSVTAGLTTTQTKTDSESGSVCHDLYISYFRNPVVCGWLGLTMPCVCRIGPETCWKPLRLGCFIATPSLLIRPKQLVLQ